MAAVKKGIILNLLFCFLFPVILQADVITITGGCSSGKILFKSVPIQTGLSCTEATYPGDFDPVAADAVELAKTAYTGGDCSGIRPANLTLDCSVYLIGACCTSNWVNAKNVLEDSIVSSGTITGVAQGSERDAAELYCNTFFSATPYIDHSSGGYVRTDGLTGYVYTSGMGQGPNTSIVDVNCWKRGGYARGSAVVTMESLGGSIGGTGGLTQTQAQDAFTAALGAKSLSASDLGTKMNDALDRAHDLGYFPAGGGSGGGTLTPENYPGLKPSDIAGTYTGGTASDLTPYSSTKTASDFSGTWTEITDSFASFKTSAKDTGLYSTIGAFFDSGNYPAPSSVPSVTMNTTSFGNHTFDFDSYSTAFLILKGVILISFSYAAFRVLMLGGRGG